MSDSLEAIDAYQQDSFVLIRHEDKVYRLLGGAHKAIMLNELLTYLSPTHSLCPFPLHTSGRPLLISQRHIAPFVPSNKTVAFDEWRGFRLLASTAIVASNIGNLGQGNIWRRVFSRAVGASCPHAMVSLFVAVSVDTGGLFETVDGLSQVGPRVLYPADKDHCAAVQHAAYYFLPCVQCQNVEEFRAALAARDNAMGEVLYSFSSQDDKRCPFLDHLGVDAFSILKIATATYFSAKHVCSAGLTIGFDPAMWPCVEVKRCACIEAAIGLAGINMQYPDTHQLAVRVSYASLNFLAFADKKDRRPVVGCERLVEDGALVYRRTVEPPHRITTWPTEQPVAKTAPVEGGRPAQWEWLPLEVAQAVLERVLLDAYAGDHADVQAMLKARLVSRRFARYFSSACGQAYARAQKARDDDPTSIASIIRWGHCCLASGIQPWLYVKWSRADVRTDDELKRNGDEERRLLFNYLRTRRVQHA